MSSDESRSVDRPRSRASGLRTQGGPDEAPGPGLAPGTLIADRFRVVARIGEGGMGEVYAADHIEMGRRVAVKVIRPELAADEANLERFRREARAASRIKSTNVVTVYDFGRDAATGRFFLAMELLEGETLGARIERERAVPPDDAVRIALSIAEALDSAHRAKVIHRDLKPENVFLETDGRVKVLDFGIARILDPGAPGAGKHATSVGMIVGTPAYINPEAAGRKGDVVEQSDLYSLGVMLFEMLVGRLPFDDPEPIVLIGLHLRAPPERVKHASPKLVIPEALDALVDRLMEKAPADRPASARVVATELRAIAAQLGAPVPPSAARELTGPHPVVPTPWTDDDGVPTTIAATPRALIVDDAPDADAQTQLDITPVPSVAIVGDAPRAAPTPTPAALDARTAAVGVPGVSEAQLPRARVAPWEDETKDLDDRQLPRARVAGAPRARLLPFAVAGIAVVLMCGVGGLALSAFLGGDEPVVVVPRAAAPPPPPPLPPPVAPLPVPVVLTHVVFRVTPRPIGDRATIEVNGMRIAGSAIDLPAGHHVAVVSSAGRVARIPFDATGDTLTIPVELRRPPQKAAPGRRPPIARTPPPPPVSTPGLSGRLRPIGSR